MRILLLISALMMTALGAKADGVMFGNDPLTRQILTKTAQENGGVTAAVRVGSGQAIELKLPDYTAAPLNAPLAAPAAAPALALKPAQGLVAKPVKAKTQAPRRAVEHLKRIADKKSWAEKP